jgi:hypothetical protein
MTGETPVLGTLANLTVASVKHNCLAPRELMLVRMAALIPADDRLPPISPTPRPPRRVGSPPMETRERSASAGERWYALDQAEVPGRLGVVLEAGLSADEAAERLGRDGPNALPVEEPPPSALRRFLAEFTSYMQLILVGGDRLAGDPGVGYGHRAGRDHALQRPGRAAPGGQGRGRPGRPRCPVAGRGTFSRA